MHQMMIMKTKTLTRRTKDKKQQHCFLPLMQRKSWRSRQQTTQKIVDRMKPFSLPRITNTILGGSLLHPQLPWLIGWKVIILLLLLQIWRAKGCEGAICAVKHPYVLLCIYTIWIENYRKSIYVLGLCMERPMNIFSCNLMHSYGIMRVDVLLLSQWDRNNTKVLRMTKHPHLLTPIINIQSKYLSMSMIKL